MKKRFFSLIVFALILMLVACGGGDSADEGSTTDSEGNASGAAVDIVATNWDLELDNTTVPAGEVTFTLTNEEGMHGIEIKGTDVSIEGDGSATTTLEPGEYEIYCSIMCGEGHDDMVSTLIVE